MEYIPYVITCNGIYDILCGLSILDYVHIPVLNTLHLNMIKDETTRQIVKRYYAYWILTYGCMRLSENVSLIRLSYGIEAVCMANELMNSSMHRGKSVFVILSSAAMCYLAS